MINKDFFLALEDLAKEKGIDKEVFIEALQNALGFAYKKHSGINSEIRVKINPDKNSIKFYSVRVVVEELGDDEKTITLAQAQEIKKSYKVGDEVVEEITPKEFGRIAAQTAKQVIMQKLREEESKNMLALYEDKEGELMVGVIRRIEGDAIYVEMGENRMEGTLLPNDRVPGEKYELNQKIKVFVKKVKSGVKSAQILVSRSSTGLVKRLFEEEVPEIRQGVVEIKAIAREAGQRTKMAIYSNDPNVDAVGACVGTKGMRVNAIVSELGGEKIDIITWSEDPLEFIAKALSPATVSKVTALEGDKVARAIVPDDKLSLAIGREGQNARLAVRLTGWKIDVKPESAEANL